MTKCIPHYITSRRATFAKKLEGNTAHTGPMADIFLLEKIRKGSYTSRLMRLPVYETYN